MTESAGTAERAILLGGTFDPIHCGHLAVAAQARDALGASSVWIIPAGHPPHRDTTGASAADRLAMVAAVAATDPGLRVLDLEIRRTGPSYSSETVTELAKAHPAVEQWFLLGADAAREIGGWHRLGDLLQVARFVLVNRDGVGALSAPDAVALGFDPTRTRILHVASPLVSGTDIRRRLRDGDSLEGLLPPAVVNVIRERGLYRDGVDGRLAAGVG